MELQITIFARTNLITKFVIILEYFCSLILKKTLDKMTLTYITIHNKLPPLNEQEVNKAKNKRKEFFPYQNSHLSDLLEKADMLSKSKDLITFNW
jgi:hypothetical protein